jgi:hypothetical protein
MLQGSDGRSYLDEADYNARTKHVSARSKVFGTIFVFCCLLALLVLGRLF